MKVFVTGGSGQVGSHVIDLLLARGDEVLAIDNFATGRRDNLADTRIFQWRWLDRGRRSGRRTDRRNSSRSGGPHRRVVQGS